MRLKIAAVLTTLLTAACSAAPGSGRLSASDGIKQAQSDFAAGHPKIYLAGSVGVYEPGITEKEKPLVAKLPRDGSLSGCTNPKAQHAESFVTAYNHEIVALLEKH